MCIIHLINRDSVVIGHLDPLEGWAMRRIAYESELAGYLSVRGVAMILPDERMKVLRSNWLVEVRRPGIETLQEIVV